MDFEVDLEPPADSPPGGLLITMVKQTVKKVSNMEKVKLVRISQSSDSDENAIDLEIACDCVKGANLVLGGLRTKTQLPTSTHLLSTLK